MRLTTHSGTTCTVPVLRDVHDAAAHHLAVGQVDEDLLAQAPRPFRLVHACRQRRWPANLCVCSANYW